MRRRTQRFCRRDRGVRVEGEAGRVARKRATAMRRLSCGHEISAAVAAGIKGTPVNAGYVPLLPVRRSFKATRCHRAATVIRSDAPPTRPAGTLSESFVLLAGARGDFEIIGVIHDAGILTPHVPLGARNKGAYDLINGIGSTFVLEIFAALYKDRVANGYRILCQQLGVVYWNPVRSHGALPFAVGETR